MSVLLPLQIFWGKFNNYQATIQLSHTQNSSYSKKKILKQGKKFKNQKFWDYLPYHSLMRKCTRL